MVNDDQELFVRTADIDSHSYAVTVRVGFDGVEHVGHLWFRDADWDEDDGTRDHGVILGRSADDVLSHALELSEQELALRFRRAMSGKRQYHSLRQLTDDVLVQIRHLNKVATSMRAGLLDVDEAAAEIASTERRLHEMVGQLRAVAGVPS